MSTNAELITAKTCPLQDNAKSTSDGSVSEILNKQDILSIMANMFQTRVFVLESFSLSEIDTSNPFAKNGESLKLEVIITNNQGNKEKHYFFVKLLTNEMMNCQEREIKISSFLREAKLYSTIFTEFEKFDKEGINRWGPRHYHTKSGKLFVLENLFEKGFYQIGRRDCLDKEHILAVMKALAAFHSKTIKLEETLNSRNDNTIRESVNIIEYSQIDFDVESTKLKYNSENNFLKSGINGQINLIDQLPGYSREEIQQIKDQLPKLLKKLPQLAKPSKKYRNVLVHGALGPNNLFFKRTGNHLEALLVNYQSVRYAPPAYDLILLLYLNQRIVFRIKEMQSLIQAYYNMFSEELAKNGICIQYVLPVKDYLESCEECIEWVTLVTVLHFEMNLLSDEIIEKYMKQKNSHNNSMIMDKSEMIIECFSKDEIYRSRMTEAMNDLIKKCVQFQ